MKVATEADIERWRKDPWSIEFPMGDGGTPPGYRHVGDRWVGMGPWRDGEGDCSWEYTPHVLRFIETLVPGHAYETVMDERPLFLWVDEWAPADDAAAE